VILKALVGSHLYGLDTEDSDYDYNGIFLEPTSSILSLHKPSQTHVTHDPDSTLHEVEKFMWLAAKGNPTVLELLFCPEYTVLEFEGQWLLDIRHDFLSDAVRASFGGYAYQQAVKLQKRENEGMVGFNPAVKNRYAKHARHCFRLLRQGRELLETGTLNPVLQNPDEYFAIGELPVAALVQKFHEEYEVFKQAKSVLPKEPQWDKLNQKLLLIRGVNP
jgi:predicted nucleotidyltransferase